LYRAGAKYQKGLPAPRRAPSRARWEDSLALPVISI